MIRRPTCATRTGTRVPYTTLFRSASAQRVAARDVALVHLQHVLQVGLQGAVGNPAEGFAQTAHHPALPAVHQGKAVGRRVEGDDLVVEGAGRPARGAAGAGERKTVVWGRSVSVRVDLGGSRSSKKQ